MFFNEKDMLFSTYYNRINEDTFFKTEEGVREFIGRYQTAKQDVLVELANSVMDNLVQEIKELREEKERKLAKKNKKFIVKKISKKQAIERMLRGKKVYNIHREGRYFFDDVFIFETKDKNLFEVNIAKSPQDGWYVKFRRKEYKRSTTPT